MKVIPKLNLNKHPDIVDNNSLIDATNLIVSKDNSILQTEPNLKILNLTNQLKNLIPNNNYTIKHILPCNKELVLFVYILDKNPLDNNDYLYIYRYNEIKDKIVYCTKTLYNLENINSTFTYNNNELIIAFSEYGEIIGNIPYVVPIKDNKQPLKVINLGEFDKPLNEEDKAQLDNFKLHSICPEVKIPEVVTKHQYGSAYKGWYYIFIRYKISNNTYTQWFNTNENIFIDDYEYTTLFNYFISSEAFGNQKPAFNTRVFNIISDNKDICNKTFNCTINNLDNNYNKYQLSFICITKSYTKCFKSEDINIENNSFIFASQFVSEYSVNNIITSYNNYYNVKSIINNNNRLYIGNYIEDNKENEIKNELKNIDLTLLPQNIDTNYRPKEPYNFFIHFVDKYGNITKGFNIGEFNLIYDGVKYINKINNNIIPVCNNISIKLNKLPKDFIGYIVSYEKLEKSIKYSGVTFDSSSSNNIKVYSDKFNYDDKIDLNFDTIRMFDTTTDNTIDDLNEYDITLNYTKNNKYTDFKIDKIKIYVADSYNNIGNSTFISISITNLDNHSFNYNYKICELIKTDIINFYNNSNKILIPCSKVIYTINKAININTKAVTYCENHAIVFGDYITEKGTHNNNPVYYNPALKYYQQSDSIDIIKKPFYYISWFDYTDITFDSLQYNNKPVVTFFPNIGLNQTDENKKSFTIGNIIECKNTIDLYQQKHVPVYELYPKILDNYNENNNYNNNFPKTIRRSNIFQDESKTIAWRNFELEQYKNITENKGNIVKLISIGYYFLVHTRHSMFLFNATDTIKSNENGIQLSSIDIWDINYKEVITSELGYAGIQNSENGIIGSFGYIFYDKDAKRIYRYDSNSLKQIDADINNFINKLDKYDLNLVDDKKNNRILFNFNINNENSIVLSYNYITNTFISRHNYSFYRGYSTKENIYLVDGTDVKDFDYSGNNYNNATCSILVNTNYNIIKFMEYLVYKVRQVTPQLINNYLPVEGESTYYAGDAIRVYSSLCDTGELNITFTNTNEINLVENITKPYWRLGNWNFNGLRNKLDEYLIKDTTAEDASRIYGNWFVVKFTFNSGRQVEIESLDVITNDK